MFNLLHKKPAAPSTIVIEGLSHTTNSHVTVNTTWQQNNTVAPITDILSKASSDPSNPIDSAIQIYLDTNSIAAPRQQPLHTIAFDSHDGLSGNIWHHGSYYLPTIKGMPERIFELCDISDNEREALTTQLHTMTATGDTVLAVATGLVRRPVSDIRQLTSAEKLSFIGFISLKITVSNSLKHLADKPNTTLYLITGQHPAAAYAVASQLNLVSKPGDICDTRHFDVLSSEDVTAMITANTIFARATPAHKKLIIDQLNSSDKAVTVVRSTTELDKLLAK